MYEHLYMVNDHFEQARWERLQNQIQLAEEEAQQYTEAEIAWQESCEANPFLNETTK